MILHLHYTPTPENAPRFAEEAVEAVKKLQNVDLDYTPSSLHHIDEVLDIFNLGELSSIEMADTLFIFGCYVGEVFVRNAGARWRVTDETIMKDLEDLPLVLELSDGHNINNPIGKVFKRCDNGMVDNLPYFYTVFTDQPSPNPLGKPKKPFWKIWYRKSLLGDQDSNLG